MAAKGSEVADDATPAYLSDLVATVPDVTTARLLTDLNDAQRAAVVAPESPLRILAGAGSGKTRVLTRRIAHRVAIEDAEASHVLALTFTRRAAGELRQRLRALGLRDGVTAGTFHGIAWAQLQGRWADKGIRPPELLTRKMSVVTRLLPRAVRANPTSGFDVINEIEWAMARLIEPDDYVSAARRASRDPGVATAVVADVYAGYVEEKRKRRLVDFDDLLRVYRRHLLDDTDFGAVQRWRFRHVFVDEFQDVNPAQHALLDALLTDTPDLCVVGDPNQAIYAWNGADARYLVDFDRWYPGGATVQLVDNYRSTPQILRAANTVLRAGGITGAALQAHQGDGPEPTVAAHPDDRAEAAAVARAIRAAHRPGGRWSSQAVLVRTNAQTVLIEQALHELSVPCRVRGGGALLDQPEVKAALRSVQDHTGTFDGVVRDLEQTARRLARGVHPDDDVADDDLDDDAPPPPVTEHTDDRTASVEALARLAHDYAELGGRPTVPGFLSWLADFAQADQSDGGGDAVDIVTLHAAKGLEWPIVHLAGIEEGLVPISHATGPDELAEERRLFYVAVTRARAELHLTWAEKRTFGSREARRRPSPFVSELDAANVLAGEARRAGPRSAATAKAGLSPERRRRSSTDVPATDRVLFEALRSWRSSTAKAARMPAYVVANDQTILAIAAARPRTTSELAAMPGLGAAKVNRYGDELLQLVAEHG